MSTLLFGFTYARLPGIEPREILLHMRDPRVAKHLPLLASRWTQQTVAEFIAAKEEYWRRDGLGHWAILRDGTYLGWGGFQREGDEWDYGLVLKPEHFGLGMQITIAAIEFAKADGRIPYVTFLLPPTRRHLQGLNRLGARFVGEVVYRDAEFRKFHLDIE